MDPRTGLIHDLHAAARRPVAEVGGKAHTLGRLLDGGFRVPAGYVLATEAYQRFVDDNALSAVVNMELGRKPLDDMRWEEIWDAALRIRTAFLAAPLPSSVEDALRRAHAELGAAQLAVRSSAPGEDGAGQSYAGLHESLVGVRDFAGLCDAVRVVWASLWSDAALLYRRELGLDVARSRMAVVVQDFVVADVSGVAFGRDPRETAADRQVVEAVPGLCEDMVSGAVDPDRWLLKRSSGELVSWTPGQRGAVAAEPLLDPAALAVLHRTLHAVEQELGYDPDLEWTGRAGDLSVLQARPITGPPAADDTERAWYLSLRPRPGALAALCERVTEDLIPELEALGVRYAAEDLDGLDDGALAGAIDARGADHTRWQQIYRDEFIPFAHGVRRLAQYYNDAVRPADPYEFVQVLAHQPLLASVRNTALIALAGRVRRDGTLAADLQAVVRELADPASPASRSARWEWEAAKLAGTSPGADFARDFNVFLAEHLDLTFKGEALDDRPDLALKMVLELAAAGAPDTAPDAATPDQLEQRLLDAVEPERHAEAREVLRIGRLSWRLRDDDNILMGRLEHQLQRALALGADRLREAGRLAEDAVVRKGVADIVAAALGDPDGGPVVLPEPKAKDPSPETTDDGVTPRQLIGQPAAAGLATARARIVRDASDFAAFRHGEVMVCDAIQPTMTHLVPLASAIVERRGGMLIHGAIIARELGVPCVNGVARATELLQDGDLVTVDGHLGIVTVGEAEFGLEAGGGG